MRLNDSTYALSVGFPAARSRFAPDCDTPTDVRFPKRRASFSLNYGPPEQTLGPLAPAIPFCPPTIWSVVLLNMDESSLGEVLAYNINDRLLGLAPVDWNQREPIAISEAYYLGPGVTAIAASIRSDPIILPLHSGNSEIPSTGGRRQREYKIFRPGSDYSGKYQESPGSLDLFFH